MADVNSKFYKFLAFFAIFFAIVYFIRPSSNYQQCWIEEKFLRTHFDGIILKKYLDHSQHSTPIVEIGYNNNVDSLYFFGETIRNFL